MRKGLKGKQSLPYKPSNYQTTHLSPSPKRMNPLNSPPLNSMRTNSFYAPSPHNIQNTNYEDQDQSGFALQLTKVQSEPPAMQQYQRPHSQSMGYNEHHRVNAYPINMMNQAVPQAPIQQNISANPFGAQPPYQDPQVESFHPGMARNSYAESPDSRRMSMNSQGYGQYSWQGYPQNSFQTQPQVYPPQAHLRQSVPERQPIFNTDSSRSSTVEMQSQSEDIEAKPQSIFNDNSAGIE